MRYCSSRCFSAILAAAMIFAWVVPAPKAMAVTDEEVGETIASMKKYLFSKQEADGSWEIGGGEGHQ